MRVPRLRVLKKVVKKREYWQASKPVRVLASKNAWYILKLQSLFLIPIFEELILIFQF